MPWSERNEHILNMFKGKDARQMALKYNITHIVVDWAHLERDKVNLHGINSIAYRTVSNGR